jgi:4-carboxymuconolactone decarboxylase
MMVAPGLPEDPDALLNQGPAAERQLAEADHAEALEPRGVGLHVALTTEIAWGMRWTQPVIDRKTRSMINLTMLSALNRGPELRPHLRAALDNGVTRDEMREILMQVGAYFGIPAYLEAFRIFTDVFKELDDAN